MVYKKEWFVCIKQATPYILFRYYICKYSYYCFTNFKLDEPLAVLILAKYNPDLS